MHKRPIPIVIISLIYLLAPVVNFILFAVIRKYWFGGSGYANLSIAQIWLKMDTMMQFLLILFPVVALGIYSCRRWGFFLSIAFTLYLIGYNIWFYINQSEQYYTLPLILIFIILSSIVIFFFLNKYINTPYFNPRMRWWETPARYRIKLDTKLIFENYTMNCITSDISSGGCFLIVDTSEPDLDKRFAIGSVIWVKISFFENIINVLGQVVRKSSTHEKQQGYGIVFTGMSDDNLIILESVIQVLEKYKTGDTKDSKLKDSNLTEQEVTEIKKLMEVLKKEHKDSFIPGLASDLNKTIYKLASFFMKNKPKGA